jgi:hypothetical protein
MAVELEQFPSGARATKYPWEQWMNGSVWKLRRGEDYEATTRSMRTFAHTKASSADMKVKTRTLTDDDGIECLIVQFLPQS